MKKTKMEKSVLEMHRQLQKAFIDNLNQNVEQDIRERSERMQVKKT